MKILKFILVNMICMLHLINAATVASEFKNDVVRVKRDDDMMAAGMQAAAGLATSFMDVFGKGGAAKDERDFNAEIPFAKFKGNQKSGMGVGDAMGEEYRRRKRASCGKNKGKVTTMTPPEAELVEERRKRQTVNDPDNVRPQFDGNTPIHSFLDSFVELAKKIGNIFVPSDPNNPQTRQQEMDARY